MNDAQERTTGVRGGERAVEGARAVRVAVGPVRNDCRDVREGALQRVSGLTNVVVVSQGLSDMRTWEFLEWLQADDNDCRVVPLTDGGVVTDYEGRSFGRALEWLLHPGELRGAADEMARIPGMEPPALEPVTA
jgi:hypothetical protein